MSEKPKIIAIGDSIYIETYEPPAISDPATFCNFRGNYGSFRKTLKTDFHKMDYREMHFGF